MIIQRHALVLDPDLRLADMLRMERRLRVEHRGEETWDVDALMERTGLPASTIRHSQWRTHIDEDDSTYGLYVRGADLSFTPFHVTIGVQGPFRIRSGGPVGDGFECAWGVLYVGDGDLPRMSLYP